MPQLTTSFVKVKVKGNLLVLMGVVLATALILIAAAMAYLNKPQQETAGSRQPSLPIQTTTPSSLQPTTFPARVSEMTSTTSADISDNGLDLSAAKLDADLNNLGADLSTADVALNDQAGDLSE